MEEALRSGVRVTLAMGESAEHETVPSGPLAGQVVLKGRLAHPLDPKRQHGMYWGYQTRLASNLAAALSECPFQVMLSPVGMPPSVLGNCWFVCSGNHMFFHCAAPSGAPVLPGSFCRSQQQIGMLL